ncbi:hypothetical protein BH09BAC3_BH09BAC3_10490 [soil metagenome]
MATRAEGEPVILSTNLFLVVGIGASAGGLEAFKELISAIPVDSGMAYILVQHLDPRHQSILPELLQKITLIPVHEIKDNEHVEPNNIYVIPSKSLLTANNGVLNLTPRSNQARATSIDLFFTSLAEIHQNQAIGVVLSGTGKDGTVGLRAIKEYGGITFAQEQKTAAFDQMPQSAIDAGVVDFVLSPQEIIKQLMRSGVEFAAKDDKTVKHPEDVFIAQILTLINNQKDVDFSYYKMATIRRRIGRRMVLAGLTKIEEYTNKLKGNPTEVEMLFQDMLISVTDFFRDPLTFKQLCDAALPALSKNKANGESLRVWVAGCSTGQEAYSIGMCLFEFLEHEVSRPMIQIFATDLSEIAITKARKGFYSIQEVSTISAARLDRFFRKTEGGYQINKSIRDMCAFSKHNLLSDPPFSNIDLVSCRNVLIYMDTFLQRKVMTAFHYALRQNGMLLLGKSESTGSSTDLFASFNESDKIYLKKSVPIGFTHIVPRRRDDLLKDNKTKGLAPLLNDDFQRNADSIILSMSPGGVIVNDQLEIVQFRGATGDWLESPSGKPSLNVLKMAKRGLVLELRSVINKVKSTGKPFTKTGILLKAQGWERLVTIEALPLLNTINPYLLILFTNTKETPEGRVGKIVRKKSEINDGQARRTEQLEVELSQTKEDLRTSAEDHEAGSEELLSANEELTSHSEELRSLNEELEISKEELQSTVEELSASNQELGVRNDELNHSRNYSDGIVSTIREPLVVLDRDLRVKSANRSFYRTFHLTEKQTEGKLFYTLSNSQWDIPDLRHLLDKALLENAVYESYELKRDFEGLGERVMLLNARKIKDEGTHAPLILLAIEDVTESKTLAAKLRESSESLKAIFDSGPQLTCLGSANGKMNYFSQTYLDYTGLSNEEAARTGNCDAVVHPDMLKAFNEAKNHAVEKGEVFFMDLLLRRFDGVYRWHSIRDLPIRNVEGTITSWVSTANDIHEQKEFSSELEKQVSVRTELLKESNIGLAHSNENLEQFAFIASHDLQEPLRKIKTFSTMLSDKYSDRLPEEGKRMVERIFNSSNRMSTLIHDVLNFSKVENSESIFLPTDLNEILNNITIDFQLLLVEKKGLVKYKDLPVLDAVPVQMNQLFYNLISNSLKFAKKEEAPIIEITSRAISDSELLGHPSLHQGRVYCEIIVKDNGMGFDQKYAEKVFSIFQRLNSTEFAGNGIGLALCKKIVLNHHGSITVVSKENVGTSFHIVVPLKQVTAETIINYVTPAAA